MTLLEYGFEDMAGDWTISLWNKDVFIVDKKIETDNPDDILYLQTAGFRIIEEEQQELPDVVLSDDSPTEGLEKLEAAVLDIPLKPQPKKRGRPRKVT